MLKFKMFVVFVLIEYNNRNIIVYKKFNLFYINQFYNIFLYCL